MEEENNVPIDENQKDIQETETETPQTEEDTVVPETTEEEKPKKSKEFQSLEAQKKHYREKAEKLESQLKNKVGGTNPMEVVKLAKAFEGYNEEEVDFISRNSKSGKIEDIISATKDEWVKDAIDARRKKVVDANKVPGSSSPDFVSNKKSPKEIADMTPKDRQKYEDELNRESTGI